MKLLGGITVAVVALALSAVAAQAAPPSCSSPRVGVPHNATTPIFLCSDPDNPPIISITSPPLHGTLSAASNGWRNYTPNAGYSGPDTFSYQADEGGETAVGTAALEVAPGSKPACTYRSETVPQATLTPLSLLCATGGDPITNYSLSDANLGMAGNQTLHGMLSGLDNALGKVSYQSVGGYSGPDTFTYTATTAFGTSDAAAFDLTVLNPQQGPQGAMGPQGQQGPPGANGADGAVVTRDRLIVASFGDALTAKRGHPVTLRYVSTVDATVVLDVFRASRRVASVSGRARSGANSIKWNGKRAGKPAATGLYRLVLNAVAGDQTAIDRATVRLTGGSKR